MPDGAAEPTFESLLEAILGPAYSMAVHMAPTREDAEESIQEAALLAYRAFRSFTPGTNFKAWFFRILTNVVRQRHRKSQREPQTTQLEEAPDLYLYIRTAEMGLHGRADDPAMLVMSKLTTEHVTSAISSLAEEYRVVAALFFVEEFSYEEIAGILDCPLGTVRSRLHRGRRMLQKALWRVAEEHGIVEALKTEGVAHASA